MKRELRLGDSGIWESPNSESGSTVIQSRSSFRSLAKLLGCRRSLLLSMANHSRLGSSYPKFSGSRSNPVLPKPK